MNCCLGETGACGPLTVNVIQKITGHTSGYSIVAGAIPSTLSLKRVMKGFCTSWLGWGGEWGGAVAGEGVCKMEEKD